jgi:hypothetical protein
MAAETPTTLALLLEEGPAFALEALPDDLLALVFVEIGEDDTKWHPKHLVRVAFVSKCVLLAGSDGTARRGGARVKRNTPLPACRATWLLTRCDTAYA